jgi:hypothetical protein
MVRRLMSLDAEQPTPLHGKSKHEEEKNENEKEKEKDDIDVKVDKHLRGILVLVECITLLREAIRAISF